ncbi:MAG: DUF692 family multinuclear iron-containing protein [Flavobacteriales bacterium]
MELYEWALEKTEPVLVLLERDFNIPDIKELTDEIYYLEHITKSQ